MIEEIYFSHNNPYDPYAHHNTELNRDTHQLWVILTAESDEMDADSFITEVIRLTGYSRDDVNKGLNAMEAMENLPLLRSIQERFYFLTIRYLSSIMVAVAKGDPSIWPELDRRIAHALTPITAGEIMMQSSTLAKKIAKWIQELEPEKPAEEEQDYLKVQKTAEATYVRIKMTGTSRQKLNDFLRKLSETGQDLADALIGFLDQKTKLIITKYLYASRENPEEHWSPDDGHLPPGAYEDTQKKSVDLDEVPEESAYAPSEKMKAFIRGRDGHCRFPGCCLPAIHCQVDHVIPWGEGGPTAEWNLQLLCQRHHNMKTDGRYTAESDGYYIKWVGPMDVPALTRPSGPLADMPRGTWGQLLKDRMRSRLNSNVDQHSKK